MGIRTKLNPLGGTSGKKYKAYILKQEGIYYDVADLGFTENIDPDRCFGSTKSLNNNYVILNGKLFYFYSSQLMQVGNLNTWTAIEGASSSAFGIADNHLYKSISGTSTTEPYSSLRFKELGSCPSASNPKPYFITTDSKLYYYSSGQVGSSTSWTDITGYYAKSGSTVYSLGVGINNGKAYYATDTNASVINSNWSVVKVSGLLEYNGRWSTCHFITQDGKLYYCGNSTSQTASPSSMTGQVGSKTSWTDISFDYGIEDGKLYRFSGANASLKNDTLNWTSVGGCIYGSSYYGYGIGDNDLYYLTNNITKLLDNCVKVYGFNTGLAICEV